MSSAIPVQRLDRILIIQLRLTCWKAELNYESGRSERIEYQISV